jgi:hypothetical protein
MFKALSDNLTVKAVSDPSIDRKALMEELRTQWRAFTEVEDGFFLTGFFRTGSNGSPSSESCHHLYIRKTQLSKEDVAVGRLLSDKQFDASDRQLTSITTDQGQELPASPRLDARGWGAAYLYPKFSLTDPKETGRNLQNTQAVIDVFNKAIED